MRRVGVAAEHESPEDPPARRSGSRSRPRRSSSLRTTVAGSPLALDARDTTAAPAAYIVTSDDLGSVIRPGAVIVDLVGGSASNRGAIEPIVECTTPDDPYFVVEGVYLSSVWGWPLVGFAKESMERYSEQILRMLLLEERVLDSLEHAPEGIRNALVAGPLARGLPQVPEHRG